MTMLGENMRRCALCGQLSEQPELWTTNMYGSPDLDHRPAPSMRFTMDLWVQECPHCGYVAGRLDERARVHLSWLQRQDYQTCCGLQFKELLAERFFRYYLICRWGDDPDGALNAVKNAAWVCDDSGDELNARICRKLGVIEADCVLEKEPGNEQTHLIRADLLRRAGCFDRVVALYKGYRSEFASVEAILAFQVERAQASDTRCFTMEEAAPDSWFELC